MRDSFYKEPPKRQILKTSSEARFKLEGSMKRKEIDKRIDKILEESKMNLSQKD